MVRDQIVRSNQNPMNPSISVDHCSEHLKKKTNSSAFDECIANFNSFITVLHFNAQSIRKKKLGELEIILHDLPGQLLCINEYWLNPLEIGMYTPHDYKLINYYYRVDHNYGGIAIFLRKVLELKYDILDLTVVCETQSFKIVGVRLSKLRLILIVTADS